MNFLKSEWNFPSSADPNAIHLLVQNIDNIEWSEFSKNSHPKAIDILEQNLEKIDWDALSGNPGAIHLLEENISKVNWSNLLKNPNATHLLEQRPEKKTCFKSFANTLHKIYEFFLIYIVAGCNKSNPII